MIEPNAKRRAAAAVATVILAIFGCAQNDRDQAKSAADDALLVAQVRAKAAAVDAATVSLVHVSCDRGVVTLTGIVATAKEREAVEAAAKSVSGVHSVVDRVVVDASAPTASQIEADLALAARIHGALVAQTGVNAAKVHVDVHRGVVTLTGVLPSAAHRDVADQTVRGVAGVVKLIDDITVAKT